MNADLLKSIMMLNGDTHYELAKYIGITPQTFSSKLNEKNGSEFTQGEIEKIAEKYKLSSENVYAIFFARLVSEKDTKLKALSHYVENQRKE